MVEKLNFREPYFAKRGSLGYGIWYRISEKGGALGATWVRRYECKAKGIGY